MTDHAEPERCEHDEWPETCRHCAREVYEEKQAEREMDER